MAADPTPSTDGAPDPKHTISLANIDRGTPEWRLHCHHGADEFRCYTETGEVDPLHEGECVLADWWDEYGIELVDIREPISALPIPVDANWSGDSWDLTLATAGLRVVPEDRPAQCDCERFGFKVPGYTVGSNWDWVPCPEGHGARTPTDDEALVTQLRDECIEFHGEADGITHDCAYVRAADRIVGLAAGVPALDDDMRREVPEVLLTFAKWADWYLEDGCRRDHHGYCQAHGLDKDCPVGPMREWLAAYLGGTDG